MFSPDTIIDIKPHDVSILAEFFMPHWSSLSSDNHCYLYQKSNKCE